MDQTNEKPKETILLLPAPKAVPQVAQESTPVGANEGASGPPEGSTPDRKYGGNTDRDPDTGRFLPGNPGKPMGARHLSHMTRHKMETYGGITREGRKVSVGEIIVDKLTKSAMDGNLKAIDMVYNRVDGKVPQIFEVGPVERQGVRDYTPEEQAEFDSLFSRNDKPETNSIAEAGNDPGDQGTPGPAQGSAYE